MPKPLGGTPRDSALSMRPAFGDGNGMKQADNNMKPRPPLTPVAPPVCPPDPAGDSFGEPFPEVRLRHEDGFTALDVTRIRDSLMRIESLAQWHSNQLVEIKLTIEDKFTCKATSGLDALWPLDAKLDEETEQEREETRSSWNSCEGSISIEYQQQMAGENRASRQRSPTAFSQTSGKAASDSDRPQRTPSFKTPKVKTKGHRDLRAQPELVLSQKQKSLVVQNTTPLQRLVKGTAFEVFSCVLVFSNVAMIGYETHTEATTGSSSAIAAGSDMFFCALFTIELAFRLAAYGRIAFFLSTWNRFDFILVAVMICETVISVFFSNALKSLGDLSCLRMLRIIRLLRALRIVRVMKLFRELRMLFMSIVFSMRLLLWSCIAVVLTLYMFGVAMLNGYIGYCHAGEDGAAPLDLCGEDGLLYKHFGGLGKTMLSLYEAMAGGISWGELVDIVEPTGPMYTAIFLGFVTFETLAILNVVTAIFVQGVVDQLSNDRETLITDALYQQQRTVDSLHDVFCAMDTDGSGTVGLEELYEAMEDERLVAFCQAHNLDITEPEKVFRLLDRDGGGSLTADEFVDGVMGIKGQANNMDIQQLLIGMEENVAILRRLNRAWTQIMPGKNGSRRPSVDQMPELPELGARDGS